MSERDQRGNDVDLGDPRDVKDKRNEALRRQIDAKDALRAIMASPAGRSWMFSLLEYCGAFRSPFASNALFMAHNVGRGDVGRYLLDSIMSACPDTLMVMIKETEDDRRHQDHADADKARARSIHPADFAEPGAEGRLYDESRAGLQSEADRRNEG